MGKNAKMGEKSNAQHKMRKWGQKSIFFDCVGKYSNKIKNAKMGQKWTLQRYFKKWGGNGKKWKW